MLSSCPPRLAARRNIHETGGGSVFRTTTLRPRGRCFAAKLRRNDSPMPHHMAQDGSCALRPGCHSSPFGAQASTPNIELVGEIWNVIISIRNEQRSGHELSNSFGTSETKCSNTRSIKSDALRTSVQRGAAFRLSGRHDLRMRCIGDCRPITWGGRGGDSGGTHLASVSYPVCPVWSDGANCAFQHQPRKEGRAEGCPLTRAIPVNSLSSPTNLYASHLLRLAAADRQSR